MSPGTVYGGGPRPGLHGCECTNGKKHGSDGCDRYGSMHDGRFLCRYCVQHDWTNGQTETPAEYEARTHRKWEDRP